MSKAPFDEGPRPVYDDPRTNVEVDVKDQKAALFASIGCFMLRERLDKSLKGDNYQVVFPAKDEAKGKGKGKAKEEGPPTLEQFINGLAAVTPSFGEGWQMLKKPAYKFQDDLCIGQSTGFYIDHGMVATAGHCVFHEVDGRQVLQDIGKLCFVFGFTENSVKKGIPWQQVFAIDRVLFGQNVDYEANSGDRKKIDVPDWALVKLKPAFYQQTFPRALEIVAPVSKYEDQAGVDLWCAGHPWGTTLKLSRPAHGTIQYSHPVQDVAKDKPVEGANKGEAAEGKVFGRKVRKFQYNNICRQNCKLNPGNSGGPLFIGTKVVGIVASGLWPNPVATNGFRPNPLDPMGRTLVPTGSPETFAEFTNATKNELWYSLIRRESQLFVMYASVTNSPLSGTLVLEMEVPSPQGQLAPGVAEITLSDARKHLDEHDFVTMFPGLSRYLPCDINKIYLTYRPEKATPGLGGSGSPTTTAGTHRNTPTLRMAIGFFNRCQRDLEYSQTGCIIYRTDGIALPPGERIPANLQPLLQGDMKTVLASYL